MDCTLNIFSRLPPDVASLILSYAVGVNQSFLLQHKALTGQPYENADILKGICRLRAVDRHLCNLVDTWLLPLLKPFQLTLLFDARLGACTFSSELNSTVREYKARINRLPEADFGFSAVIKTVEIRRFVRCPSLIEDFIGPGIDFSEVTRARCHFDRWIDRSLVKDQMKCLFPHLTLVVSTYNTVTLTPAPEKPRRRRRR